MRAGGSLRGERGPAPGGTSHAATLTSARAAAAAGCPALAELLQLAERGHGAGPGGEDVGVGPPRVETAIGWGVGGSHCGNARAVSVSSRLAIVMISISHHHHS
ncbi:unnamed protein product [Prorocentrum cordatum]|uniref:Uncharacterized protein n=1 Tax=Prorocentrum cordatum TaxID=2364126 RepID=A0ABN9VS79_9DINO|nr:unnamed protein product [Polarella glacialis]